MWLSFPKVDKTASLSYLWASNGLNSGSMLVSCDSWWERLQMVKIIELLLHSKHSEDQKNRETVVFKKVKQINKKSVIRARGSIHPDGSQRRGVAVFGQIYQRTWLCGQQRRWISPSWNGRERTVSVGGMQGKGALSQTESWSMLSALGVHWECVSALQFTNALADIKDLKSERAESSQALLLVSQWA